MKKICLVLIFCSTSAFAVEIDNTKFEYITEFSGGLNTQKAAHQLNKNQTPNAENGLVDEKPGSLVKRNGFILVGSSNVLSKVNFMMEYINPNNQREMIVSDSSRVLTTRDFVNYTVIKTTLTPTAQLHGTQGRGKALLCNGVDPCFFYDGSKAPSLDGSNGYPNVPTGKYPIFYLDRFWVGNTTASNSGLAFSENTSTDGFIIDPLTDPRAWPVISVLNIGLGDGKGISGLDTLRNLLQVHKDNGAIFTVFGIDDFTFEVKKTAGNYIGTVSQDSVGQSDNYSYYLGKDGVYQFDSINAVRISDDIFPDIQAIVGSVARIVDNTWDSKADFVADGLAKFAGTTVTANGIVQPLLQYTNLLYSTFTKASVESGNPGTLGLTKDVTWYMFPINSSATDTTQHYTGFITSISFFAAARTDENFPFSQETLRVTLRKSNTNEEATAIKSFTYADLQPGAYFSVVMPSTLSITTDEILALNILMKVELSTNSQFYWGNAGIVRLSVFNQDGGSTLILSNTTGSYTSQISTVSNVNFWDQFNTAHNSNGGIVSFYIKGGTSPAGAISTETWTSISPGAIITLPTNKNYIQWSATIAASNIENLTNIDKVVINHNESGSLDSRPIGLEWKKRYWLLASTQVSGTSTLIYVKSRITNENPNAWMKFTGLNLRSITRFGDNLYGGSSSNANIYRLDYGTNDNGNPINFFWDTPELILNDYFMEKIQSAYFIDCDRTSGATLTLGTSVNGGSFNTNSIDLDGSGRLLMSLFSIPIPAQGNYFRYRFLNNELDKPITLHTFGVRYMPTEREP